MGSTPDGSTVLVSRAGNLDARTPDGIESQVNVLPGGGPAVNACSAQQAKPERDESADPIVSADG